MRRLPEERRGGPPHNPQVGELVQEKRYWSDPIGPAHARLGFHGWHERGYLPHRDTPGLVQFLTFHLADSLPASAWFEWADLHGVEGSRERRRFLQDYLDCGRGSCLLRRSEIGGLVEASLCHFHRVRYELRAWVVMPNHVHALVRVDCTPVSRLVKGWKSFTARRVNALLGRFGSLWQEDYWDTYARGAAHEQRLVNYIEGNPVKAHLVEDPQKWPWSSARFRDERGVLCLGCG